MDPIQFIQDLELVSPPEDSGKTSGFQSAEVKLDQEQAFINERSISSFTAEVSTTARQDILDTTLLAALAAEKKFPDHTDPKAWFNFYADVLSKLGWVVELNEDKVYSSGEAEFDVDQAIIDIMSTIVAGPVAQAVLIRKTLESLKGLADDDGKIRLFESRAKGINNSHFQIGMSTEVNDAVSLHVSNFSYEHTQGSKKILFIRWGKDRTSLNYQFFQGTMNKELYSRVRFKVKQKLAPYTQEFVDELEI